jgi:hypothetical protein
MQDTTFLNSTIKGKSWPYLAKMDNMMAKSRATGAFVHTATMAITTPDTIETAVEAAMEGNRDPKDGDSGDSDGNSNINSNNIPMQMDIDICNISSSSTNTFPSPSLSHLTSDTPATSPPLFPLIHQRANKSSQPMTLMKTNLLHHHNQSATLTRDPTQNLTQDSQHRSLAD